jgi:hypothetical protein
MGKQHGSQSPTSVTGASVVTSTGGGSGTALTIQDEGVAVDTNVSIINFIGADVRAMQAAAGNVSVYIPTPNWDSHWNTSDGSNGNQSVTESISRTTARISTPTSEGNPFKTNGWANSNQAATNTATVTFTTASTTTGFGGNATMTATMYDADGSSVLETYTTPSITGNGANTSGTGRIVITISGYAADTNRFKAKASVEVQAGAILTANSLEGGRYHCVVTMTTDSASDGTGPYVYTQTAVFYDTNPSTPSLGGTTTIAETGGSVQTKHLSGVEYYITGSTFTVAVPDIDNLNRNTARSTSNLQLTGSEYGLATLNQSPFGTGSSSFSGWTSIYNNANAAYSNNGWAISASTYRYRGTAANVAARARDPWGNGSYANSANASILIDTYGTTSSDLNEDFDDENRRQTSNYNSGNTAGNWTSANALQAGEALVMGGHLLAPNQSTLTTGGANSNWSSYKPDAGGANPNYAGIGVPVSYYRTIVDSAGTSRSAFTIVFTGTFVANATTDLANEHLKIFIRRRASAGGGGAGTGANALLLHGAEYNFASFDDGASNGQIRLGSSSANTVQGTFGGFSCETGFFMQIQIANATIKIDTLEVTFS